MIFIQDFAEASQVLDSFINDSSNFFKLKQAGDIMLSGLHNGGKIISCGNGGSMSDAMHFAEELTGSFRDKRQAIPAISISDPSHITCTANDFGFNYIFSRYVEALGQENDVLLVITTSGNSQNIIEAARVAIQKHMKVIALTGNSGGLIKDLCDVEIRVPYRGYSDRIQEIHIKIIHSLIHYIEQNFKR